MESLRQLGTKTAFDVVVDSQVALHDVSEIAHDLISIFVEQPLQLAHFFIVIEILLVLSVKLREDGLKVLERLNKLQSTALLGQI